MGRQQTKLHGPGPERLSPAVGPNAEPPERLQHDTIVTVDTERAGVKARRVETQRLLDRYRKRQLITERQWRAGEQLYQTWMRAAAPQVRTTDFSIRVDGGGRGLVESERQAQQRKRVHDTMRAIGKELSGVLVHTVLLDESPTDLMRAWQQHPQAGMVVLRLALDALARCYGV